MKLGMKIIRRVNGYYGPKYWCPHCCRMGIHRICACGKKCGML